MPGMAVGYARTSTAEQIAGLEAQVRDLTAAGAERIFQEHVSGTTVQRPELRQALSFVRSGDTLVVTKPDRLARSTADLLSIVQDLTARGIGLVLLSMGGQKIDTRNPTSKLMLTMLAAIAAFERDLTMERMVEGVARAKAEGKYKGRQPTVAVQATDIRRMRSEGVKPVEIARKLGVARSSVYRMLEHAP